MEKFIENKKVLYVDDEPNLLSSFQSLMRKEALEIFTLNDSTKIEELLAQKGPFALIISDQRMPNKNGVEVFKTVTSYSPDTIKILLTGYSDFSEALGAINEGGISRYISKPWDDTELKRVVHESINKFNLVNYNKFLLDELKKSNDSIKSLLNETLTNIVGILSDMMGRINQDAMTQTQRVRKMGSILLERFDDLSEQEKWEIKVSLDLFNLGLVLLPTWVQASISKSGLSSVQNYSSASSHNLLTADLITQIPGMSGVAQIIRLQNKNYDGTGEPIKEYLFGDKLPFGARLLHILINLDNLTTANYNGIEPLKSMIKNSLKYDSKLIERIINILTGTAKDKPKYTAPGSVLEYKDCTLLELDEGNVIKEDIVTASGIKLASAGSTLSNNELKILRIWNSTSPDKIIEPVVIKNPLFEQKAEQNA